MLAFERYFAAFHGAKHGTVVTHGTGALEMTMLALELCAGNDCTNVKQV